MPFTLCNKTNLRQNQLLFVETLHIKYKKPGLNVFKASKELMVFTSFLICMHYDIKFVHGDISFWFDKDLNRGQNITVNLLFCFTAQANIGI